MIRLTRRLIRFIGWLLTPFVAWAASFLGGWIGAEIAAARDQGGDGVLTMVIGAAVAAATVTGIWAMALFKSARVGHPAYRKLLRSRERARSLPTTTVVEPPQPPDASDPETPATPRPVKAKEETKSVDDATSD